MGANFFDRRKIGDLETDFSNLTSDTFEQIVEEFRPGANAGDSFWPWDILGTSRHY